MDKLYSQIGQRIRIIRKAVGMTQAEVAERVGIDPSFYGQVERGANIPSLRTLFAVAAALGVEPSDLLPRVRGKEGIPSPFSAALDRLLKDLPPEKKRFMMDLVRDVARQIRD